MEANILNLLQLRFILFKDESEILKFLGQSVQLIIKTRFDFIKSLRMVLGPALLVVGLVSSNAKFEQQTVRNYVHTRW